MFRLITGCKHRLEFSLLPGRLIFKCKKCKREWDTAGVEQVPYGFSSRKEYDEHVRKTGFVTVGQQYKDDLSAPRLPSKQIAPLLAEWLIQNGKIPDTENLRSSAKNNPDEFVRQINEQLGVRMR